MLTKTRIAARPAKPFYRRANFLVLAVLLQGAMIFALMEGLNVKIWPQHDPVTAIEVINDKPKSELPPPPMPERWVDTVSVPTVPPPDYKVDTGPRDGAITLKPAPGPTARPVDVRAAGVMETHTTPPYPPLMVKLGAEGTVKLRLTVGADGRVTDATVIGGSGYDPLDQAARVWVIAHWRYRPAMSGGQAVASQTVVAVRFDLKNAH